MKPIFKTCQLCGGAYVRRGPFSKFCPPCAEARKAERQRQWAREHPQKLHPEKEKAKRAEIRKELRIAGPALSEPVPLLSRMLAPPPELLWYTAVQFPFSYSLSKNRIWGRSKTGMFLRPEVRRSHQDLAGLIAKAMEGRPVVKAKVWLDIWVEKPNHKGDAVNVVDFICDSLKKAIGVDDRWFCIRRLDWSVSKRKPMVLLGFGQTTTKDTRLCSLCGREREDEQMKCRRECRECYAVARAALRGKTNPRAEISVTEVRP